MNKILEQNFFNRPTLVVAQELLGKYLVRVIGEEKVGLQIHEVEAYDGPEDLACHAAKGRTSRTEVILSQINFLPRKNIYWFYF